MKNTSNKISLEIEPIPSGSEAFRMIDTNRVVKFVCICSPMEKKSDRYIWLGYGEMSPVIRTKIREYLHERGVERTHHIRVLDTSTDGFSNHSLKVKPRNRKFETLKLTRFWLPALLLSSVVNAILIALLLQGGK